MLKEELGYLEKNTKYIELINLQCHIIRSQSSVNRLACICLIEKLVLNKLDYRCFTFHNPLNIWSLFSERIWSLKYAAKLFSGYILMADSWRFWNSATRVILVLFQGILSD